MRSKSKQADFLVTALIFILPKAYFHIFPSCTSQKYPTAASLFKSSTYHTHSLSDRGCVYRETPSLSASMLVSVAMQEGATQHDTHSSFKCHAKLRTDKTHNRELSPVSSVEPPNLYEGTHGCFDRWTIFPAWETTCWGTVCDLLFGLKR